jgi:hypothetical protein
MKIGRNDPCPCGSGKKYKKCCYGKNDSIPPEVSLEFERMQAKQSLIEKQQGLGRSIISIEFKGYRMVAVGSRMYYSQKWKTFHDFLLEYIRLIFGKEWGQPEFAKPFEKRHPVVQWYEMAHKYMKEHQKANGTINVAPMTDAMSAYINLSYNLYLLAHNVEIQERLIRRLKDISQFRGAQYETYVAAEFIKAGFGLEIENEEDNRTTHCEFTAISKKTGRKYSIEAKARQLGKKTMDIGNQLYNALKKQAKHERIIFIDINITNFLNQVPNIIEEIKRRELSLTINGNPAPSAYLFITNHPFEYDLEGICENRTGLAHGYKIPDFSFDFRFTNIRDVLNARKNHQDMFDLIKSICEHEEIPSTFDGEHPEFAFADKETPPRLFIGGKYRIPDKNGGEVEGVLVNATVSETEKKIFGVYRIASGQQLICTNPMTDEELIAYRRQPDTFFGVPLKQGKKAQDPLDLFDFFYESYKGCPRQRLLEFVKGRPDFESLKNLSDEELLISCCEGWVYSAINK